MHIGLKKSKIKTVQNYSIFHTHTNKKIIVRISWPVCDNCTLIYVEVLDYMDSKHVRKMMCTMFRMQVPCKSNETYSFQTLSIAYQLKSNYFEMFETSNNNKKIRGEIVKMFKKLKCKLDLKDI